MPDPTDIHHGTPRRPESGQAAAEFAMVLPILMIVIFGIVEFGMAFWNYQQVSAAASEGARRAAVSRTNASHDSIVINAAKNATKLDSSKVNVSISSTWSAGSDVTVTVTYPQKVSIMGVTFFDGTLTGRRTARLEA